MMSFRPPTDACRPVRGGRALLFAFTLIAAGFCPAAVRAAQIDPAPGDVELDYVPQITRGTAYAIALDDKQRAIIGGENGILQRLTVDGAIDAAFFQADFGSTNRLVYTIKPAPLSQTIVAGRLGKNSDGSRTPNIVRLNPGGSLDGFFRPGDGASDSIVTALVQPISTSTNYKIVIGGLFTEFDGQKRGRLARLNFDGSLDGGFDSGLNFDNTVFATALQADPATGAPNGQIVVGGSFNKVNGSGRRKLARVNFDGSVDGSFDPDISDDVFAVAVQPDGKILVGGQFLSVNGDTHRRIVRLNFDGSTDGTFNADVDENDNQGVPPTAVYSLVLQNDGRILVGGNFLKLNGDTRRFFGRLETDGSVDGSFDSGDGVINRVQSIAVQSNGRIVVAETLSHSVGGVFPPVVRRLFGDQLVPAEAAMVSITAAHNGSGITSGSSRPTPGVFVVRRSGGNLNRPLTVHFSMPVTVDQATRGVDYRIRGGVQRTFRPGVRSLRIKVVPMVEGASTADLTVTMQLDAPGDGSYKAVAGASQAAVSIPGNK